MASLCKLKCKLEATYQTGQITSADVMLGADVIGVFILSIGESFGFHGEIVCFCWRLIETINILHIKKNHHCVLLESKCSRMYFNTENIFFYPKRTRDISNICASEDDS